MLQCKIRRKIAYAVTAFHFWIVSSGHTKLPNFQTLTSGSGCAILAVKQVKSAERALLVLEYFEKVRTKLTVNEISSALNWPQSSTSELLHFLSDRGYLAYDRERRVFSPTAKVAVLGSWVEPKLFREGRLLPMLDWIGRETGELVVMATQVRLEVQYIQAVQATNPMRMYTEQGALRPMLRSAMGRLFLSKLSDRQISEIAWRINAEGTPEERCAVNEVLDDVRKIRRDGYSISLDRVTPGGGMIAILLPTADALPFAVGIGGMSWLISEKKDYFVDVLRTAMSKFIGEGAPSNGDNGSMHSFRLLSCDSGASKSA